MAVKHLNTGLNFAINAGTVHHSSSCADPGAVSGRCRGDDKFLYLKGGVVRNFNAWGPTAIYAEHYNGWRNQRESDQPVLSALELNVGTAAEMKGSTERMWGFGIVQTIKGKKSDDFATDLYLGYRNYSLNVDLLSAGGGAVSSIGIRDFSAVMAGMRFRWNDDGKD